MTWANKQYDYDYDYTPITLYPTAPLYKMIIIIFLYDTVLRQKGNFEHEK